MSDEQEGTDGEDGVGGALSDVVDTLGDLVTGIPAPIRKNAFKAFGRLCTAAVEYPVALIEDAIAEKHAESRARVKLIDVSASQIAEQMKTNPEYARAAVTKFARKIIRERVNVDEIAGIAAANLKSEQSAIANDKEPEAAPISEDWLNAFESEAAQISSEQMKNFFAKVLEGEIKRPTSYSIKTIKLLAQLDNRAATLFRLLCSLSISLRLPNSNNPRRPRSVDGQRGSKLAASLWSVIRCTEHSARVRPDNLRLPLVHGLSNRYRAARRGCAASVLPESTVRTCPKGRSSGRPRIQSARCRLILVR
jgi:hypothetical protein